MFKKIWQFLAGFAAATIGILIFAGRKWNDRERNYRGVVQELRRARDTIARERIAVEQEKHLADRARARLGDQREVIERERTVSAKLAKLNRRDGELLAELRRRHKEEGVVIDRRANSDEFDSDS